jgi:hypothetical protein
MPQPAPMPVAPMPQPNPPRMQPMPMPRPPIHAGPVQPPQFGGIRRLVGR